MKFTLASALAAIVSVVSAQSGSAIGYASLNGGTTGGRGGATVTVSNLAALTAALGKKDDTTPKIIRINGLIRGADKVYVGSNKSLIGTGAGAGLEGLGLLIVNSKNVIIQNLKVSKVIAANGDGIGIETSTNVWVDHCEFFNDLNHGKDYYDGLVDVKRAADFITISNSYFHDHFKGSLVGHSDSNGSQDRGKLRVTYANNRWSNIGSRTPSVRFGTAHIINSVYDNMFTSGVDTRQGAQVLVESTVFANTARPLGTYNGNVAGFAVARDVNFGSGSNTASRGSLSSVPYSLAAVGSGNVRSRLQGNTGNTLSL